MTEQDLQRACESVNGLFRNKVRVIQAVRGYRVSEDALILTWFVRPAAGELILDAGTGCGVIAFGLAAREPSVKVIGLEIQDALANRAGRGVCLNGLEACVGIVRGDFRQAHLFFRPGHFDAVVSNPPYYERGRGRINLQEEKALSRHQLMMPLPELFAVARRLLKESGRLSLIYPAACFERLGIAMKEGGFQATRMLWIHPYRGAEPCLVCVEAKQRSHAEELSEEALVLYESQGKRTPDAEAVLAGE